MSFMYINSFTKFHENDSYENLLELKNKLEEQIKHCKENIKKRPKCPTTDVDSEEYKLWVYELLEYIIWECHQCSPTPKTIYKYSKEYLKVVKQLLKEKAPKKRGNKQ